jgi:hypothetical protein
LAAFSAAPIWFQHGGELATLDGEVHAVQRSHAHLLVVGRGEGLA